MSVSALPISFSASTMFVLWSAKVYSARLTLLGPMTATDPAALLDQLPPPDDLRDFILAPRGIRQVDRAVGRTKREFRSVQQLVETAFRFPGLEHVAKRLVAVKAQARDVSDRLLGVRGTEAPRDSGVTQLQLFGPSARCSAGAAAPARPRARTLVKRRRSMGLSVSLLAVSACWLRGSAEHDVRRPSRWTRRRSASTARLHAMLGPHVRPVVAQTTRY